MPILNSTYTPSLLFKNAHINTVYKTLFYKQPIQYKRTRIHTPDNDFLDLDFSLTGSKTIVIAIHGLEGSSNSKYILSLVNFLNSQKKDCLALNLRGCSGEDNTNIYSYNSGQIEDISLVVNYLIKNYNYKNIVLVGYSMGGNMTLKYMGECENIPNEVKCAVGISVPTNLEGSSNSLSNKNNYIYLNRFLKSLKEKTILKANKHPSSILNKEEILNAKNFVDFDNAVTAPLWGFKDASDYWTKCSSKQFIKNITTPTLLINALDDTFLSKSCYPFEEAKKSTSFYLETPKYGGHVGFNTSLLKKDEMWSEKRINSFIQQIIS